MKKLIATAAASVLALATISAGDGLKVSGFIRGGLSDDITDSVADADHSEAGDVVIGNTWVNGDHWGGASRGRLTVNYDGDNGGVCFRFQPNLGSSDYFTNGNVKYAMAYANFFDSAIIVEGGKLTDRYTGGDDDIGAAFDGVMGARLVVHPVDGLYIGFQGSAYNPSYYNYDAKYITPGNKDYDAKKARRQGNAKFDANLFSLSAKYEADAFAVAAGVHFSGVFYGSFKFTGVENLEVTAGFNADYADHWKDGSKTEAGDGTKNLVLDATLEYNADPVLFGLVAYCTVADDAYFVANAGDVVFSTINPYVEYKLSDITALRAESTLFIPKSWDEDKYGDPADMYLTLTPSVVFNASEKADVNVWLQISSDTDQTHHSTGVGVRYNF